MSQLGGGEKKATLGGGRAERSEVVHETPQKRGGMKKPVQELKARRKARVSPTSPSKLPPLLPSKSNQPTLPSVHQRPVPALTDASNEESKSDTRTGSRITQIRRHVELRRRKGNTTLVVSSSEDEAEEPVPTITKKRKRVKRARAKTLDKTPDLTSDSEEEQSRHGDLGQGRLSRDSLPSKSTTLSPQKVMIYDLRGGGGGGTNYLIWLNMGYRIMEGVRRAQLPLTLPLNDITEGDGNCFFRAVCSQCQRPDVNVDDDIKHLDHAGMREKICLFMRKSRLPCVLKFKRIWDKEYTVEYGDYDQYWINMAKPGVWAAGPVLPATAWFLERSINIVSEKADMDNTFLIFNGNQDGSDKPCAGAPLWLGHLTGVHYQTLMLDENEPMPPPPPLQTFQEILKAQAKASDGEDQQRSQPGTSKASGVGKVGLIHSLFNLHR